MTQARHRILLQEAVENLEQFLGGCFVVVTWNTNKQTKKEVLFLLMQTVNARQNQVVFAAEDLRHAATSLGRITGRVDVEEVLDVLFKDFCIGK